VEKQHFFVDRALLDRLRRRTRERQAHLPRCSRACGLDGQPYQCAPDRGLQAAGT